MKVIDFGECPVAYRYRVTIDMGNKTPLEQVRVWADNNDIECTIIPGVAFFRREEDVLLFMLRWA